jgi:hypothetical protein
MVHRNIWFWKNLHPIVLQFCRREGLSFNEVVNCAVQNFLGQCSVEELRLKAKLFALLREEAELRRVSSCMLRSGAYLPSYVEKVLKEQKGKPSPFMDSAGEGDRPLRALSKEEEKVFRKICSQREKIAREMAAIQAELLKDVEPFRMESEASSWSRARDRHKPVNNVRDSREGDVYG